MGGLARMRGSTLRSDLRAFQPPAEENEGRNGRLRHDLIFLSHRAENSANLCCRSRHVKIVAVITPRLPHDLLVYGGCDGYDQSASDSSCPRRVALEPRDAAGFRLVE